MPDIPDRKLKPGAAALRGRLTGQSVLLLAVHGLFAVAGALSGTFVNVYLWKVSHEWGVIGWFAASSHVVNTLTFFIAGKWVKERGKLGILRAGLLLSALFYLAVLLMGRRSADFAVMLGALQGLSAGLFWLAFNVIYFEVTDPSSRDRFNGWAGLLAALSGMIAPWSSGFLIARLGADAGYRAVFTLSLAVFAAGALVSFLMRRRRAKGTYEWLYGFRQLGIPDSPWRNVLPALAAQGFREGVFVFLIGVLVYTATRREMLVGNYFLAVSAVSIVSFWLAGRLMKPHRRRALMMAGVVAMPLFILPFFFDIRYSTLLAFGIGTSLVYPLFAIPMTSAVFDLIGRDETSANHRVELIVLREGGLNIGRLAGTLAFVAGMAALGDPAAGERSETMFTWLILGIGSFPLMSWLFMAPLLRRPDPGRNRNEGVRRGRAPVPNRS